MINLLPETIRSDYHYAFKNVRLVRYTAVAALTMAAIALITGLSILGMLRIQNNLENEIEEQNQKLASYKPLEAKGQKLADQISTIDTLLSRQVTFSTLIPDFAKILPPGAVLAQLEFSASDILPTASTPGQPKPTTQATQKPFVISARITDHSVATTLLENVRARKDLFTDADLVQISKLTTAGNETGKYPYQVTINAYLKKLEQKPATSSQGGSR